MCRWLSCQGPEIIGEEASSNRQWLICCYCKKKKKKKKPGSLPWIRIPKRKLPGDKSQSDCFGRVFLFIAKTGASCPTEGKGEGLIVYLIINYRDTVMTKKIRTSANTITPLYRNRNRHRHRQRHSQGEEDAMPVEGWRRNGRWKQSQLTRQGSSV
jgi:hypothetical protein